MVPMIPSFYGRKCTLEKCSANCRKFDTLTWQQTGIYSKTLTDLPLHKRLRCQQWRLIDKVNAEVLDHRELLYNSITYCNVV